MHLAKTIKPVDVRICRSLSELEVSTLKRSLADQDLRCDPLSIFQRQSADVDLARGCLQTFILLAHQRHLSKQEERLLLTESKIGMRALQWLMEVPRHLRADLVNDPGFAQALCYCLAAADESQFIMKCLTISTAEFSGGEMLVGTHPPWKSIILRKLLETQAYWTRGETFDESALSFLQASGINTSTTARRADERVPMAASAKWFVQVLPNANHERVTTHLYEACAKLIGTLHAHEKNSLEHAQAVFELGHPSSPIPDRAIRVLRASAFDADT